MIFTYVTDQVRTYNNSKFFSVRHAACNKEEKVIQGLETPDWTKMQSDLNANITAGTTKWTPVYVPCSFKFNGREWYKAGIRYKGNSSLKKCFRRSIRKYSFKLDFNEFEDDFPEINDQRFYGFKQLNLANGFDDMSLMLEKAASDLFRGIRFFI